MCADYLPYSETEIPVTKATREGVKQVQPFDPYKPHSGAEMFTCTDMQYEQTANGKVAVKSLNEGAWIYIKGADFADGAEKLVITAKGKGKIELRLDERKADPVITIEISADIFTDISVLLTEKISGTRSIYFVFSDKDICLESWQAE